MCFGKRVFKSIWKIAAIRDIFLILCHCFLTKTCWWCVVFWIFLRLQSNCALEKQAKVPVCETVHLQDTGCGFKKYINKTCAIKITVATVVIILSFLPCGAIRPPPAYKLMANAVLCGYEDVTNVFVFPLKWNRQRNGS